MAAILGPFYTQLSKQALVQGAKSTAGAATSHLVPLMFARLAVCSETGVGDSMDETLLKTWIGRDPMAIRQLFKEQVTIKTQAKLVALTNNKPNSSGDNATIDRLHFIESTARFQIPSKIIEGSGELPADDLLVKSLIGSGEDVMDKKGKFITGGPFFVEAFVWILRGSVQWYANLARTGSADIPVPLQAQESTKDFVKESDPVNVWVEACTVKSGNTSGPELYNNFTAFCDRSGESKVDKKQFLSSLGMKGYKQQKGGNRLFIGISITPPPQPQIVDFPTI
jgi:phage/plasmid-associated DNA primase